MRSFFKILMSYSFFLLTGFGIVGFAEPGDISPVACGGVGDVFQAPSCTGVHFYKCGTDRTEFQGVVKISLFGKTNSIQGDKIYDDLGRLSYLPELWVTEVQGDRSLYTTSPGFETVLRGSKDYMERDGNGSWFRVRTYPAGTSFWSYPNIKYRANSHTRHRLPTERHGQRLKRGALFDLGSGDAELISVRHQLLSAFCGSRPWAI